MAPYDIDSANPGDSSLVSEFPDNERDSRLAIETALEVEHSYASGMSVDMRHKFGVGTTAARDVFATEWVNVVGALWFNTDEIVGNVTSAKTVLQVYDGTASYGAGEGWLTVSTETLDVNNEWTAGQFGVWQELTWNVSLDSDWRTGHAFYVDTVTGDFTLENPDLSASASAAPEFQTAIYYLLNDGVGSHTISFGSKFVSSYSFEPALTVAADSIDILMCTLLPLPLPSGSEQILVTHIPNVGNTGW